MLRVLVCGSRDWADEDAIRTLLNGYAHDDMPMTVIAGGAQGADSIAAEWAEANQPADPDLGPGQAAIGLEVYPARWDLHGKGAGPLRNQRMLDEGNPDIVWAFVTKPLAESRGTADMVCRARAAEITVYVVQAWPVPGRGRS